VDGWMVKNPHLAKFGKQPKKINEPVVSSSNSSAPPGLINGFIAKHQLQLKNNGVAIPQTQPPPIIPSLLQVNVQKEESQQSNYDRKRPAPQPPPPPPPQVNTHQQSDNGINKFPKLPPSLSTPSTSFQNNSNNNSDLRARGGPSSSFNNNQHNNQGQASWQNKGHESSGNRNQSDYSQPKRPRRDDLPTNNPANNNPVAIPYVQGLCEICNVILSSQVMADQHLKGSKHAARVAALAEQQGGSGSIAAASGVVRPEVM